MNKKLLFFIYVVLGLIALAITLRFSMSESQPMVSMRKGDGSQVYKLADISVFVKINKSENTTPELTEITLSGVGLPPKTAFPEYSNFCLTEISIEMKTTYQPILDLGFARISKPWTRMAVYTLRDLCLSGNNQNYDGITLPAHIVDRFNKLDGTTKLVNTIDPADYYPFDMFSQEISVKATGQATDKNGNTFVVERLPFVDGMIIAPGWHNYPTNKSTNPPYDIQNQQKVDFYRATTQLFLIPILFGSVFILIAALLVIEENSTILEISIGILLGLWGVQDLLVPQEMSPVFIQSIILSLYVFLLVTIAARFLVIKPFWIHSDIPVNATQVSVDGSINDPVLQPTPVPDLAEHDTARKSPATLNIISLGLSITAVLISLLYFWKKSNRT